MKQEARVFSPMAPSQGYGLDLLRFVLCAIIFTHGAYRFYDGTTGVLGDILASRGFPYGHWLAGCVNLAETGGALLILVRRFAVPASLILMLIYGTGIILFHGRHGFFVIQPGNGGWEYSALLILCLAVTLWSLHQPGFTRLPLPTRPGISNHSILQQIYDPPRSGLDLLRIGICGILLTHGICGLFAGTTPELGSLPRRLAPGVATQLVLAFNLVWVVAPALVAIRIRVVPLSLLLIATLCVGITLWHAANGFFVVGPGDDGWEFSALLITCLVTTAWAHWQGAVVSTKAG